MDGASSQSIYNQKFNETDLDEGKIHEESMFQTAIVPLKLVVNETDIWTNDKPSSSHFCRPLHLQYKKETEEVTQNEARRVRNEMENLTYLQMNTELQNGKKLSVHYNIDITMLDGKAVITLTIHHSPAISVEPSPRI